MLVIRNYKHFIWFSKTPLDVIQFSSFADSFGGFRGEQTAEVVMHTFTVNNLYLHGIAIINISSQIRFKLN